MTKVRIAVILGFALAFAAGGSVGMLAAPEQPLPSRRGHGPDLTGQLGLTSEQREKMHDIWTESVFGRDKEFRDRKRVLWQEKDEAIEGLLTDEQRIEYDEILADCDRRMKEMDEQWQEIIQQAVLETRKILTEEQAKKYDEFRARRRDRWSHKGGGAPRGRSHFGPGGRGPGHSAGRGSDTKPALDGNLIDQ